MADTKISALTAATTPLAGTEVLPIVQSGVTKKVAVADLTAGRAVSAASLTLTGTPLGVSSGGTGLSSLTANQVIYGSFSQSSNLFFDGTILGVGTSSPSGFATRAGFLNGTVVCAASSTSYTAYFGVQNDLNYNGGMALRPSNYSTYGVITANCLNFYYGSGDIAIAADGSNNIKFGTGNNVPNRMQIFASGGVSIGNTTDPGASNLYVTGTGYFGNNGNYGAGKVRIVHSDVQLTLRNDGTTTKYWQIGPYSSANTIIVYNQNNTGVYITDGGTSWTANSDERLKNVTGIYENALDDLMQIRPVKFTWKSDKENKPCVGVIAQSVETVVPEAVDKNAIPGSDDETEYLGVRYTELIPILIASIQELKLKLKDAGVAGF